MTGDVFGGNVWYGAVAAAITAGSVIGARLLDRRATRRAERDDRDDNDGPALSESQTLLHEWHAIRDALRDEVQLCHQEREDLRRQLEALQNRVARLEANPTMKGGRGRSVPPSFDPSFDLEDLPDEDGT